MQDAAILQNLRNTLAGFNGEKGKTYHLLTETFKWLVQATNTQEGGLAALDLLCKIRSKFLYPHEEISREGADVCLATLQNKGIEQTLLALEKIGPSLLNSHRSECLKAAMQDPNALEQEKLWLFLANDSTKEASALKEDFFIQVVEKGVQRGDLETALKSLKQGEKWISLEAQESLKMKIFEQLIGQNNHELILRILQDKSFLASENETYRKLAVDYFRGLMKEPLSQDALWRMQRLLLLAEQTFLSEIVTETDFIAWIEFFLAIPKPVGERAYKGLTSYDAMHLQLFGKAIAQSKECSKELLFQIIKLFDPIHGKDELFLHKIRTSLLPQFLPFLNKLTSCPEKLLTFLEFASIIRLPLEGESSQAAMDACFPLLKLSTEDKCVKAKLHSVLTLWYSLPAFFTKKNVLQALHLYVDLIAQMEENDQVKWINKLPKLTEKASAEDQLNICETIIEQSKLLLDASRFSASFEFLKLSFNIPNQKTLFNSYQILIHYCEKQYEDDEFGCIDFLVLHHPLLKKDLKNEEFREFLLNLVNKAINNPEPTVEGIVSLVKEYQIESSAILWEKLIELLFIKSIHLFPNVLPIWEKSSLQLKPGREKDDCWLKIIDFLLTEPDSLRNCGLLKRIASKEISFSNQEMALSVYEKVLNYFLPTLEKLSSESIEAFASLRKELRLSNQPGRFEKVLFDTLKKTLTIFLIPEVYEEALCYSEACFLNIEKNENISDLQDVLLLIIELIHTFDEEDRKKFSGRVLQLINSSLSNNDLFDFTKIFSSISIDLDSFFIPISVDILLKILDTAVGANEEYNEEYQAIVQNFLSNVLKKESKFIPIELLEKLNAFFNHKKRLALVSKKALQELRILFLKQSISYFNEKEQNPLSWIQLQLSYVLELETRREIVQLLFEKLYRESSNFDFFKNTLNQCFKLLEGKNTKENSLTARFDFIIVSEFYQYTAFCEEKEKYFEFLLEIFKDLMELCREIKVETIYELVSKFCSKFIDVEDYFPYSQRALKIAKDSGIFEQFEWGTHYYNACFLISCKEEEMVEEKMLNLSGGSLSSFEKDDYMAMCLLAIQLIHQNQISTITTKKRVLKILNFAHPFLDCHYLKASYMNNQILLLQWFENLPTEKMDLFSLSQSLECYDFLYAWGKTLLVQIESLKDLIEAESIENFIEEHCNPKFKTLINYRIDIHGKQKGSVGNPLKVLIPTTLVHRILFSSFRKNWA